MYLADSSDPPLPSLNALRAFEAAARHGSFTSAAAELHVTQTAVSHQIRHLEDELGVTLFHRTARHVTLTEAGSAWALALGDVFSRLHAANRRLRRSVSDRASISVTVVPSFGSRWLIPRLGKFLAQYPDFDIRISVTDRLVRFAEEPFDVGIRYGAGRYPGTVTDKLGDDAWLVVCAPDLPYLRELGQPAALAGRTLLYDDDADAWRAWFEAQNLPLLGARYTQITDSSLLVDAAVRGQGVALARRSLAVDELAAGKLVAAFPGVRPLATGRAFYLSMPWENVHRPELVAFREWIREEARALSWSEAGKQRNGTRKR